MLLNNLKTCTRLSTQLLRSSTYLNAGKHHYLRNLFNIQKQNFSKSSKNIIIINRRCTENWKIIIRSGTNSAKSSEKVQFKRRDVRRLFSLAKPERYVLAAAMACLIISSSITMLVPYALGKILDIIFSKTNDPTTTQENLKNFCLVLCGVFVLGGLANFGRVYLFNSASMRIVKDLRASLYGTMLKQKASWFDTKGTGELINRLSTDSYLVGNSLSQNLSDGLRSTVMVVAGTGMMIYTSPQLALISSCIVPFVAGMAIFYGRYIRNITKSLLDKFAYISKTAEEHLSNIKTVKIFGKEEQETNAYHTQLVDALKLGYREVLAKSIFFGMTGLSGNIIIISVLYYGGSLVISDQLSVGALTSFILYAGYTAISINGLSNFYTELNKGVGSAHRIWEILDNDPLSMIEEGIRPTTKPKGDILFENVHFQYPTRSNLILNDFNMSLLPGTTTAIVGRSGAGKSTIPTLLLRLYDPQKGAIYLDGMDTKNLSPTWLRRYIGAVSQEPILFSGSIRDNILYGLNPGTSTTNQEFQRITRECYIDEFARTLPNGLDTVVGQRGVMLSGGQKQRVAIARALIKNPKILILDEATSALDALSEELVQSALDRLTKGLTVITIAHRLSTIRNADNIVVLEKGSVGESGSYTSLMRKEEGIFRDLVQKQTFHLPSLQDDKIPMVVANTVTE